MPLPILAERRPQAEAAPAEPPPPGIFEQIFKTATVEQDKQRDVREGRIAEGYEDIAAALGDMGMKRDALTRDQPWYQIPAIGVFGPSGSLDWQKTWREMDAARTRDPSRFKGYPKTQAEFEQSLIGRRGERAEDQAALARASGAGSVAAGFAGGMVADMSDTDTGPFQFAFGAGGGSLLRRALMEGVSQAGQRVAKIPDTIAGRAAFGEETGVGDILLDVGGAFAGGLIGTPVMHGAGAVVGAGARATTNVARAGFERAVAANWDRLPAGLRERWAARATMPDGSPAADHLLIDMAEAIIGRDKMSLAEKDAANVLRREAEIADINPYGQDGAATRIHTSRLAMAMSDLAELRAKPEPPPPIARPATAPAAGAPDFETSWRAIMGNEGGVDAAGNFLVSPAGAVGPAQLMPATAPDAAKFAKLPWDEHRFKTDARYNTALGRAYYKEMLRRFKGDPIKAAAAYNAGPGNAKAGKGLLGAMAKARAAGKPDEWERFLPAETQKYLADFRARTGAGKPAAPAAPAKPAAPAEAPPAAPGEAAPAAPGEAAPAAPPPPIAPVIVDPHPPALPPEMVTRGGQKVPIKQFHPDEIDVDAALMQFKSGGDEQGVTARLRGVKKWNSVRAGTVTVWESLDGRRLIVDGHQRLGLAKRILEQDPDADIEMNAFVLREADGVTAQEARVLAALDNIAQGSGTRLDAAKVFREVGDDPAIFDEMPISDGFVRESRNLAKLSDEAFGAVINEVIPDRYGAIIGELAPDPATHMGLVQLLHDTEPANPVQARAIVKQGIEAGFAGETQDELFGGREIVSSLFKAKARLLDKTIGELRKLKGLFQVAVRNAETLDAAGNQIDVDASAAEAAGNAQALALVEKLALRKGNVINEALNTAAGRLAAGEPFAAVLRDLVATVRATDLRAAITGIDEPGAGPGAGGRGLYGDTEEGRAPPEIPGDLEPPGPTYEELEAAGQGSMFMGLPSETVAKAVNTAEYGLLGKDPAMADPMGPAITAQTQQFTHDMEALAPLDDRMFSFGEGAEAERTIASVLAEFDGDDAAIAEVKGCLL